MQLEPIADGVYLWEGAGNGPGDTNMGAVVDPDGITVIDTGMVPSQWRPFAEAIRNLELPVRRIVLTSADIWHVGGTRAFPNAGVYATKIVSDLLDQPLAIAAYCAFMPEHAGEFAELAESGTRSVTHLIDAPAVLTERIEVIPAPGHSSGDCVVLIPDTDVCFAGSLLTVGTRPLCFAGNPSEWVETLSAIREFATRFVPGRGPLGTRADVDALRAYLTACIGANGDLNALIGGPWETWTHARFDAVNIECAQLRQNGTDGLPPTMLRWITPPS
ncbi:MAG: MBL fold metallo-hydrolase [Acidimicrobiia bacterium]